MPPTKQSKKKRQALAEKARKANGVKRAEKRSVQHDQPPRWNMIMDKKPWLYVPLSE